MTTTRYRINRRGALGLLGGTVAAYLESWSRLSEQIFRVDKWSLCRG